MNDWFYQPVTTQRFMRGFDRFAWPTVDDAKAYIKTLSADEQARKKIYKRSFSSDKCVVYDPDYYCVRGKEHFLCGGAAEWIRDFAISEN